jgi:hypothetical protein
MGYSIGGGIEKVKKNLGKYKVKKVRFLKKLGIADSFTHL